MEAGKFKQLPLKDQIQWVWLEGEFVMDIRYYNFKVNLYLVRDFYIEVFYHHKEDRVEKIEILDRDSNRMKFYADQVKLGKVA
ncbi:MAG: hypothetical protein GY816_17090 [Cytophagales bacterium]|nr:hypothetical protein [Cytophagales bacterium]